MTNWLSRNLARLTLVGPILLVIIVGILFTSSMQDAAVLADTEKRGQLLKLSNALLHEVQKERGMTAGFIGSEGSAFSQAIKSQRRAVDTARATLADFASDYDDDLANESLIKPMNAQLSRLSQVRSRVDSLQIPLGEALGFYTGINRFILDFNGVMASQTSVPLFKQKFTVLYNFSFSKEGAGIERALLSNAFGAGSFSPAVFNRWLSNKTQQSVYLQSAIAFATDEFRPYLISFEKSEANQKVLDYRQYAEENASGTLDRSATNWFAAATARIDGLKQAEDILFEEIIAHAQDSKSAAYWLMFAELALLVLMFLLSYVIFSMLTARRQQSYAIRKIMVSVAEDQDLHDDVEQITHDDLGEIAIALNRTLAELRRDFASIQQHASEIASASTETAATTEQTNVNIAAERDSVSASRKSAEALNTSIEEDIVSIGKVNETAGQARQIARDGAANVANAVSGIRTTAAEVQNVGTIMSELNARVEDILGMVDVIRSVAEQTNLLALNAAIEAARAGEQGRGFAVVADEVRALAQRTQESTEQISKVVDELTSSSNRAIQSVEQGNLQATEAVAMAEQINQTLDSMANSMVTLDEVAKVVLSSAQTQQSAVEAMTDEIRNIDVMSEENASGAQHISAAANQLSNIADEMLRQAKRYRV